MAQRSDHRDGQHQRRFTDRFAAVDDAVLGRVGQQCHAEVMRCIPDGGDLVRGWPVRQQVTPWTPYQRLAGQPPESLDVPAFDLADVDGRQQRLTDIVEDVDAADTVLASQARDFDLDILFAFTYVPGFFAKAGYREIDRGLLPLKAWKDCLRCPKFTACDEIAVVRELKPGVTLTAGERAAVEPGLVQLPSLRAN